VIEDNSNRKEGGAWVFPGGRHGNPINKLPIMKKDILFNE
jgi:hypothetical protein